MTLVTFAVILVWIVLAVSGMVLGLVGLMDASFTMELLHRANINGPVEAIAKGHIRRERMRIGVSTLFLVAGVVALTPMHEDDFVISMALVVSALALITGSILDARDRGRIRRMA